MSLNEAKKNTEYVYTEAIEAARQGKLASRPVDDIAILAYGITKEELEPYYAEEHLGTHWSDILNKILANRNKQNI